MEKTIHESVFMYRFYDGILECFEGPIKYFGTDRYNYYKFCRNDRKMYTVSEYPNRIHCGNVWMFERDDKEARMIIKRHIDEAIAEHELEIERLKKCIELL